MTQEEKDLLLKDLCSRLPYRVVVDYAHNAFDVHKGHYVKQGSKCILTCYLLNAFISPRQNENGEYIKPYLFPIESMSEEQKKEISERYNYHDYYGLCIEISRHSEGYWDNDNSCDLQDYLWLIDWFNKNHFDYRGLIPMGLAKDATGLNIY